MQKKEQSGSSNSGLRNSTRSAGRPSKPVLDKKTIAEAALKIIDCNGESQLTMQRLASRLNVAVAAIYNHIADKAELLLLVQDLIMEQVDTSALEEIQCAKTPVTHLPMALKTWATSYRNIFARYPTLVPVIATMPVSGTSSTLAMYESLTKTFQCCGISNRVIPAIIIGFESFLFGSAIDANAPAEIFKADSSNFANEKFSQAIDAFTSSIDNQQDNGTEICRVSNPYADAPFMWGLDALIAQTLDHTS